MRKSRRLHRRRKQRLKKPREWNVNHNYKKAAPHDRCAVLPEFILPVVRFCIMLRNMKDRQHFMPVFYCKLTHLFNQFFRCISIFSIAVCGRYRHDNRSAGEILIEIGENRLYRRCTACENSVFYCLHAHCIQRRADFLFLCACRFICIILGQFIGKQDIHCSARIAFPRRKIAPRNLFFQRMTGKPALTVIEQLPDFVLRHIIVLLFIEHGNQHIDMIQQLRESDRSADCQVNIGRASPFRKDK